MPRTIERHRGWPALLALFVLIGARSAPALECHVDTSKQRHVRFVSDAPVEDFEGVTDRIDGYVLWKGDTLVPGPDYTGSDFYFEVALASLDTGIRLRNSHMCENYLETDRYPYATFRGAISRVDLSTDSSFRVVANGTLAIHGVERALEIVCRVVPDPGGYRVSSAFQVALPDFNIEVPSLMFLKIDEVMELELDFCLKVVQSEN